MKRIAVAGGVGLAIVVTPIALMSLADTVPASLLMFIVWDFPAMFVHFVAKDQASVWMAGVLAWALWSVITYAVLWLSDVVRVGSSELKRAKQALRADA